VDLSETGNDHQWRLEKMAVDYTEPQVAGIPTSLEKH